MAALGTASCERCKFCDYDRTSFVCRFGTSAADNDSSPGISPYAALPADLANSFEAPFTDDLEAMVKRRVIRGTVFNRTHYFVDKGLPRGLAAEGFKRFEGDLNKEGFSGELDGWLARTAAPATRFSGGASGTSSARGVRSATVTYLNASRSVVAPGAGRSRILPLLTLASYSGSSSTRRAAAV